MALELKKRKQEYSIQVSGLFNIKVLLNGESFCNIYKGSSISQFPTEIQEGIKKVWAEEDKYYSDLRETRIRKVEEFLAELPLIPVELSEDEFTLSEYSRSGDKQVRRVAIIDGEKIAEKSPFHYVDDTPLCFYVTSTLDEDQIKVLKSDRVKRLFKISESCIFAVVENKDSAKRLLSF